MRRRLITIAIALAIGVPHGHSACAETTPAGTRQIAQDALVYGYPMVMNYAVLNSYFIDQRSPEYKGPMGQIYNTARVYTPADKAIVTPNSDTPYSFLAMDLRAEPYVICNPKIERPRYFSIQLVDLYTFNYGYIGSRTTGDGAECNMIAGPEWTGATPRKIAHVFRSETEFSLALFRTQLFNPGDIENVKKIQAGYRGEPLSKFEGKPAPPAAPAPEWPAIHKPLAPSDTFNYLNFVLQFCPPIGPAKVEVPLRTLFAKIGIEAGKPFSIDKMSEEQQTALEQGMQDGLEAIKRRAAEFGQNVNGWLMATHGFGDRRDYGGEWTFRAAVAMAGIYANTPAEALYPLLANDSDGEKPDCTANRYELTFPAGKLPPVNAFWSVTMYDANTQLLVANPINRYLINSAMLPNLKKNADGSLTIYMQHDSPGADKESNWLPAPAGPIYVAMRLYWPKQEALNGLWTPPAVQRVK